MEKTSQIQKEKIKGFIYLITNQVNGKKYVGQTRKPNPYKRIEQHFFPARKSVDLLVPASQKYGRKVFSWEILICCFRQEDLNFWEKYYIKEINTLSPFGYNLRDGGLNENYMSEEARRNLSLALKGKLKSRSHRKRMSEVRKGFHSPARQAGVLKTAAKASKPVLAQKVEGGEFLRFKSVEDAARQLNGQPSCITRVCRGVQNRTQHLGYKFWFA